MIRWKYSLAEARAVSVECDLAGWPNKDADGETQYVNTHFDLEDEAWAKLVAEAEAGVVLSTRERRRRLDALQKITEEVAEDADRLMRAKDNWEACKRQACTEAIERLRANTATPRSAAAEGDE